MNVVVQGLEKRMNHNDKFTVIAAVLSRYFDDPQLRQVMAYWKSHYSREPAFVLQSFVKEICTTSELVAKRSLILREIVQALNHSASERLQNKNQTELSELELCFYDMLGDLRAQTPAEVTSQVASHFLVDISQYEFDGDVVFGQWFEGKSLLMPNLPEAMLGELVGSYYRTLCEYLGPVDADELFASTIAQRKQAGQARLVTRLI